MKTCKLRWTMALMVSVLAILAVSPVSSAITKYQPSSWSLSQIEIAGTAGLTPKSFDAQPYTDIITRGDFCQLLINTCQISGYTLPEPPDNHPFTDTEEIAAEQAYLLGLISGYGNGIFSPEKPLTRQMSAVMLSKLRMLIQSHGDEDKSEGHRRRADKWETTEILDKYCSDSGKVSEWARPYMADVYSRGLLVGEEGNRINPGANLTREQAVILVLHVLAYCDEASLREAGVDKCILPAPAGIYISETYYKGDIILNWSELPSATGYNVVIYKNGVNTYNATVNDTFLDLRPDSEVYENLAWKDPTEVEPAWTNGFTNELNQFYNTIFGGKKQSISVVLQVVPLNKDGEPSVFSLRKEFTIFPWANENEMIYGVPGKSRFASAAEASLNMTTIKVKAWNRTSSGTKTTRTITLTVHKNVAENVKKIFAEIYNGKERFPIKNCSAYAFRNGTSQHSAGIAVDINSNENYFIGPDGKIKAGSLWSPGKNPYSIPQNGDVVRAFNKYGWHWSPDMNWSNGADYMHFSLMGT